LAPIPAAAQAPAAPTLSGRVTDPSGKPLKAHVTATGARTSKTFETGSDGTFSVTLPAGSYSIEVAAPGFQTTQTDNIIVPATRPLVFALPTATLQTIGRVVTSSSPTVINSTAAARTIISDQVFVDQGQTQVMNVLDEIPGVEVIRSSGNSPGSNTSISVRGAQPYETQDLIDGHPVTLSATGAYGFNTTFLNSNILGSVEVLQGPGAMPNTVENAIGGSVNFRTPTIMPGFHASFIGQYDTFQGQVFGIKASDTFGKLGVLVAYASNVTPGYVTPGVQLASGGTSGSYVSPAITAGNGGPANPRESVIDYGVPTTENFSSQSQLAKLSYAFSPQTSVTLSQLATQSLNDETGTLASYTYATIVPCLPLPNCSNYTNASYGGLIGTKQYVQVSDAYPANTEFDNEPIYAGEFRTVLGPGSFLARYYTGTISRTITQLNDNAITAPCGTPACPVTVVNGVNQYDDAQFYQEYTFDVLHGEDAQYTVPVGVDSFTLGFDRHLDNAFAQETGETNPYIPIQSISYSLRGDIQLTPKLLLETGNYYSNTSFIGSRFDPRDGLVFKPNSNLAVRASFGTAFVAPYYNLVDTGAVANVANGTLTLPPDMGFKPETSVGWDVGTDVKFSRDTLLSVDGYVTNLFNRFTNTTYEASGEYEGKNYTKISQLQNEANVKEEGVNLTFIYAPQYGFGFRNATDFLRDYAYNQLPSSEGTVALVVGTPANNVQTPDDPYMKIRNDAWYQFKSGQLVRIGTMSYGANNSWGQHGFTEYDAQIRTPLKERGLSLSIGGSNLTNINNYNVYTIYNGGYTYPALSGALGYTSFRPVAPRTVYVQLRQLIGPGSANPAPYSNTPNTR
jgi:outer membrane receptor protein involved in Fe transport